MVRMPVASGRDRCGASLPRLWSNIYIFPIMGEAPRQMEFRLSPEGAPISIAGQSLEVARDYAQRREQLNVPVGTFEALNQLIADMCVVA
jgi:hypothetical protein